jgi:hypothetical protein
MPRFEFPIAIRRTDRPNCASELAARTIPGVASVVCRMDYGLDRLYNCQWYKGWIPEFW